MMISNQKNYYSTRVLVLAFSVLLLMLITFFYVGTKIIPTKLRADASKLCLHHLKDKSYQVKQLLLENVNNSKLWLQNRDNTFFDSKWFGISFYEHDGKEWILKDFKLNNVVLDIYKIAQSEYLKIDQGLTAPHMFSEQIGLQESKIQDLPVLVLDVPNNVVGYPSNHLIRITFFTDQFASTLNSDEKCKLRLMDTKGNFLIEKISHSSNIDESSFLATLQNNSHIPKFAEVSISQFQNEDVLYYKVLKNLYMLGFVNSHANTFLGAFIEIGIFNFVAISILIIVCFTVFYKKFQNRINAVNSNIQRVSKKDYQLQFDLSRNDELSSTEEEVSLLADKLRKK